MHLIFVYGTLKRGGSNHGQLGGQTFIGEARTIPGYRLFALDGYPGMVTHDADAAGVSGEVWSVDAECLRRLDEFEGVPEGLYRRIPISLLPPFAGSPIETYLYARDVSGRPELGDRWPG